MSEHPILFSGPMVRALLDGSKTQTRRVIKDQSIGERFSHMTDTGLAHLEWLGTPSCGSGVWDVPEYSADVACPYGQPGDRLWVWETFVQGWPLASNGIVDQFDDDGNEKPMTTFYRATSPDLDWCDGGDDCPIKTPWKPSIHMPRKLSRITLEITGVRVEKLQDISPRDCEAEGCKRLPLQEGENQPWWTADASAGQVLHSRSALGAYHKLWNHINGAGSWDANPWVWVVEFKRVLP